MLILNDMDYVSKRNLFGILTAKLAHRLCLISYHLENHVL